MKATQGRVPQRLGAWSCFIAGLKENPGQAASDKDRWKPIFRSKAVIHKCHFPRIEFSE